MGGDRELVGEVLEGRRGAMERFVREYQQVCTLLTLYHLEDMPLADAGLALPAPGARCPVVHGAGLRGLSPPARAMNGAR